MPRILYLGKRLSGKTRGQGRGLMTNRRKKWKRSLTSKKDFLPLKKACRAREISWLEEYLCRAVNSTPASRFTVTYSERTANETPAVLRKWLCTRMKSNEDGTMTTVLTLWTADFRIAGSICEKPKSAVDVLWT